MSNEVPTTMEMMQLLTQMSNNMNNVNNNMNKINDKIEKSSVLESTLSQKCQEGILKSNESKSSSRKTSRAEQDATRVQDAAEDTTH